METLVEPTVVKITRLQLPSDLSPVEHFIGLLVDEKGGHMLAPEIGKALFLAGDKSKLPWLFRTDTIYSIQVFNKSWLITTENGARFLVENEREFQ